MTILEEVVHNKNYHAKLIHNSSDCALPKMLTIIDKQNAVTRKIAIFENFSLLLLLYKHNWGKSFIGVPDSDNNAISIIQMIISFNNDLV